MERIIGVVCWRFQILSAKGVLLKKLFNKSSGRVVVLLTLYLRCRTFYLVNFMYVITLNYVHSPEHPCYNKL